MYEIELLGHTCNLVFPFQGFRHGWLMVAAIDFGTHTSGLAFCFTNDYCKGYRSHSINLGTRTHKIPTTVLMQPNGKTYVSVGEEAEIKFIAMDIEEQKKYYLFKEFKMILFDTKVSITKVHGLCRDLHTCITRACQWFTPYFITFSYLHIV